MPLAVIHSDQRLLFFCIMDLLPARRAYSNLGTIRCCSFGHLHFCFEFHPMLIYLICYLNLTLAFSYLEVYVGALGRLRICGSRPSQAQRVYWPFAKLSATHSVSKLPTFWNPLPTTTLNSVGLIGSDIRGILMLLPGGWWMGIIVCSISP